MKFAAGDLPDANSLTVGIMALLLLVGAVVAGIALIGGGENGSQGGDQSSAAPALQDAVAATVASGRPFNGTLISRAALSGEPKTMRVIGSLLPGAASEDVIALLCIEETCEAHVPDRGMKGAP